MSQADYQSSAETIADQYGIPQPIFLGLIQQESGWNTNAYSSAGAIGLTQLMPSTASGLGVNPWDPMANLKGGAAYLASLYQQFGSWADALGAYNAGPGAWTSVKAGNQAAPAETTNYISSVEANAQSLGYTGSFGSSGSGGYTTPPPSGYGNIVTDASGNAIGTYATPTGTGPAQITVNGATAAPTSTTGTGGTALTVPTPITDLAGNLNNLFSMGFWQGAMLDILAILAILLLFIFGGYKLVKGAA